jgi:7,8-dihydropterin-6-yl-methyl-4-(beta-D-ribofuranosyl)aminobenzene 5'-phosphate synthase
MKVTIIYDNETYARGLQADWGFSCLVEAEGAPRMLFDAGAEGDILLRNMERLDIQPGSIDEVFISHPHWDHTGGLASLIDKNPTVKLYLPASMSSWASRNAPQQAVCITEPARIHERVFSTGELGGIEQSLVVDTANGLAVVSGCSHPGVGAILDAASRWGEVRTLIGGLHGFRDYDLLSGLELVCPCHCTQFKSGIEKAYPMKYTGGGAGRILEL